MKNTRRGLIFLFVSFLLLTSINPIFGETGSPVRFSFTFKDTEKIYGEASPGEVIPGKLSIGVLDDAEATFTVSLRNSSGNMVAKDEGKSILNSSTWVNFSEGSTITIDGSEEGPQSVEIPFEITLPENLSPGDYNLMFMAKLIGNQVQTNESGANFGSAIGLPFRFFIPGERVYKMEFKDLEFNGFEKNETTGREYPVLTATYRNVGNSIVAPFLNIEAESTLQNVSFKNSFELIKASPGDVVSKSIHLSELEPFYLWADVTTTLAFIPVDINSDLDTENTVEAGSAKLRIYNLPWEWIIPTVGVICLVLLYLLYRQYSVYSLGKKSKTYVVGQGETLQSICEKFKVPSKKIVSLNKLKSPYFLSQGQKILIPYV